MDDILASVKEKLDKKILNIKEHAKNRIYIDVDPKDIIEVARILFKDIGCRFAIATGADTPEGIEIIYHFSYDKTGQMVNPRVLIKDKKNPRIESITPIIKGAEWIEREIWELLGIHFENHPDLRRLLLADDWPEGVHPLRHDEDHDHSKENK